MNLITRHDYKISRNGVYKGMLRNVQSEFNVTQDINTGSASTVIDVGQSLDTASEDVEPIETESGQPIETESGQVITTERSTESIGLNNSGLLIANGNDIEVVEYSDDDPNGVVVFSGYIVRWRNKTDSEQVTTITAISNGRDLKNYIYGNSAFIVQTQQLTTDDFFDFAPANSTGRYVSIGGKAVDIVAQSFSGLSYALSKLSFQLARGTNSGGIPASVTVTMKFYEGAIGSGTLLDTVTASVPTAYPTFGFVDFTLASPITLSSSKTYHVRLTTTDYTSIRVNSAGGYAGGNLDIYAQIAGTYGGLIGYDATFKLSTGTILTNAAFVAKEVSDMVREAIAGYGGSVTYTGASIDNTGYVLDYDFIMATPLDIVQKARELAPADFYWYVDPATQVLYFKSTSATAIHRFTLRKEINALEIEASIEDVKNVVYFVGGPTSGVNLLKKYTNAASLALNRVGLEVLKDNRVTDSTIADTLADNFLDENEDEQFLSSVTIGAEDYDIDSINLGDTVAFQNFGNFVDYLILQITSTTRYPDYVKLTLGKLDLKSTTYVDQIRRDLDSQQTLDNPSSPS